MFQRYRPTLVAALAVSTFSALLVTGCATSGGERPGDGAREVMPFSSAKPDGALPTGWLERRISRFKKDTLYRLVPDENGVTVVEAKADAAASGLAKELNISPWATPWISWRWRVPALIPSADNTQRDLEDSPARVIVTFDGDESKLDFEERALSGKLKALTGRPLPYATLMYIWENRAPRDEVITSAHSSRVKMIVVESGPGRSGQWLRFERNIAGDFEKAFGEKPGRIKSLGILTDTDNTGESTVAYYGDIRFSARPAVASGGADGATQVPGQSNESLK